MKIYLLIYMFLFSKIATAFDDSLYTPVITKFSEVEKILKNLGFGWSEGLKCFSQQGFKGFNENYCDNPEVINSHPNGTINKELSDKISLIVENISKGTNLDDCDKVFLKWLDISTKGCTDKENSNGESGLAIEKILDQIDNRDYSFLPSSGPVTPFDGKSLTKEQVSLLLKNPVFPFSSSGRQFGDHYFQTAITGEFYDSISIFSQDENKKIKDTWGNFSKNVSIFKQKLLQKNPQIFFYIALDHYRNQTSEEDFNLFIAESKAGSIKDPVTGKWEMWRLKDESTIKKINDLISYQKRMYEARKKLLTINDKKLSEMIWVDDQGKPITGPSEEVTILKALGVNIPPPPEPSLAFLEWETDDRGRLAKWNVVIHAELPKSSAREALTKIQFDPNEVNLILNANKRNQELLKEQELFVTKLLLHDENTIRELKVLNEQYQDYLNELKAMYTKKSNKEEKLLGKLHTKYIDNCAGKRASEVENYARNKIAVQLRTDSKRIDNINKIYKEAQDLVINVIKESKLSPETKQMLIKHSENTVVFKPNGEEVVKNMTDLKQMYSDGIFLYENLSKRKDLRRDDALEFSKDYMSRRPNEDRQLEVNASFKAKGNQIEAKAGYLTDSALDQMRAITLHTIAHEIGHSIDPTLSLNQLKYTPDSQAIVDSTMNCKNSKYTKNEDFADLIADEALGKYFSSKKMDDHDQKIKANFLLGGLSETCNTQKWILDEHSASKDRAKNRLLSPGIRKNLESLVYFPDPIDYKDCGAFLWDR